MFAFGATMLEMTSSRPLPQSGGVHSAEWHRLRVRDNKRAARGAARVPTTMGTPACSTSEPSVWHRSASCKRSLASRTERVASEPLTASRRKWEEC